MSKQCKSQIAGCIHHIEVKNMSCQLRCVDMAEHTRVSFFLKDGNLDFFPMLNKSVETHNPAT